MNLTIVTMWQPPTPLDYAPAVRKKRRFIGWIVLGVIIGGATVAYSLYAVRRGASQPRPPNIAALWKKSVNDSPAPTVVPFDDNPAGPAPTSDRLRINAWDGSPRYGRLPRYWFDLRQEGFWIDLHPDDPVLFLHELTSSSGQKRLVLVYGHPTWPGNQMIVRVGATIFSRGSQIPVPERECAGPRIEDPDRTASNGLRIFAGQSDRNDPSHFTIAYQINSARGTIDGRLMRDENGAERVDMSIINRK